MLRKASASQGISSRAKKLTSLTSWASAAVLETMGQGDVVRDDHDRRVGYE